MTLYAFIFLKKKEKKIVFDEEGHKLIVSLNTLYYSIIKKKQFDEEGQKLKKFLKNKGQQMTTLTVQNKNS